MNEDIIKATTKSTVENVAAEVAKNVMAELTPILNQQQELTLKLFDLVRQQQSMTTSHQALTNTVISRMDALEKIVEQHMGELSSLKAKVDALGKGTKADIDNAFRDGKPAAADKDSLQMDAVVEQKQLLFDQKKLMQERKKLFDAQEAQFIANIQDVRSEFSKLWMELQQKVDVIPVNLKNDQAVKDMITSMNLRFSHLSNKLKEIETVNNAQEKLILAKNTEIAEKEKEILKKEKEMSKDPLTGLYNVGYLNHVVANEEGRWVGITIDLDNFKRINDTFGHAEGDRVLKDTARCIHEAGASMADTNRKIYIFRRGGDEMAVLVKCRQRPDGGEELAFAMRLAEAIRERVEAKGDVTVSVGVGGMLLDTPCDRLLFEQHKDEVLGDKAAYQSKKSGRNRVSGPQRAIQFCSVVPVVGGTEVICKEYPQTQLTEMELDQRQEEAVRSLKELAAITTTTGSTGRGL